MSSPAPAPPLVRWLPRPAPYAQVLQAMRRYTQARTDSTPDEIWLVEHEPVYTLGQAGKPEHVLAPGGIALVRSDRGGQVTYHGPGQLVAYGLIDLARRKLYIKQYVALLEQAVIDMLLELGVSGATRLPGAPGVYVPCADASSTDGGGLSLHGQSMAKIAALGIKVSKGRAYHGVALNVDMDLRPYTGINPCGYEGLRTTDLAQQGARLTLEQAGEALTRHWLRLLAAAP